MYKLCITLLTFCGTFADVFESSEVVSNSIALPSCSLNACEDFDRRILTLTRRVLSLEQPLWRISTENLRWPGCSEGPCHCSAESVTVNCWRLSLNAIPSQQTIPIDTAFLDLGTNKIQAIHRHAFRGLSRLVQLDLSDNLLDYLPDNLFENLESLKYLLLHRNAFDSLHPEIFRDLSNLQTLDLSENNLIVLPSTIWSGTGSLRSLQLSRNHLTEWKDFGALRNLEQLDLTRNDVANLTSFWPLRKLTSLKLGENKLSYIDEHTFQGLINLELLSLHQNKIEELPPKVFKDLRNVINLDLSGNQLQNVTRDNFIGLNSLIQLTISQNSLTILRNSTFEDLTTLDQLSLQGNNLESLEPGSFMGLRNLTWLLLGNNMLQMLSSQIFLPISNLTRLELDNNDLLFIEEETFEHLKNLQSIKLGTNSWNCDCNILYLSNWVRDHSRIILDIPKPKCRDPTNLADRPLHELSFNDVCDSQWKNMQRPTPT